MPAKKKPQGKKASVPPRRGKVQTTLDATILKRRDSNTTKPNASSAKGVRRHAGRRRGHTDSSDDDDDDDDITSSDSDDTPTSSASSSSSSNASLSDVSSIADEDVNIAIPDGTGIAARRRMIREAKEEMLKEKRKLAKQQTNSNGRRQKNKKPLSNKKAVRRTKAKKTVGKKRRRDASSSSSSDEWPSSENSWSTDDDDSDDDNAKRKRSQRKDKKVTTNDTDRRTSRKGDASSLVAVDAKAKAKRGGRRVETGTSSSLPNTMTTAIAAGDTSAAEGGGDDTEVETSNAFPPTLPTRSTPTRNTFDQHRHRDTVGGAAGRVSSNVHFPFAEAPTTATAAGAGAQPHKALAHGPITTLEGSPSIRFVIGERGSVEGHGGGGSNAQHPLVSQHILDDDNSNTMSLLGVGFGSHHNTTTSDDDPLASTLLAHHHHDDSNASASVANTVDNVVAHSGVISHDDGSVLLFDLTQPSPQYDLAEGSDGALKAAADASAAIGGMVKSAAGGVSREGGGGAAVASAVIPPPRHGVAIRNASISQQKHRSPSTSHICRRAAERPVDSPGTLWVSLQDDDGKDDDDVLIMEGDASLLLTQKTTATSGRLSSGLYASPRAVFVNRDENGGSASHNKNMNTNNNNSSAFMLTQVMAPSPSLPRAGGGGGGPTVVFGGGGGSANNRTTAGRADSVASSIGTTFTGGGGGARGVGDMLLLEGLPSLPRRERSYTATQSRDTSIGATAGVGVGGGAGFAAILLSPSSNSHLPPTFRERRSMARASGGGEASLSQWSGMKSAADHGRVGSEVLNAPHSARTIPTAIAAKDSAENDRMRPPSLPPPAMPTTTTARPSSSAAGASSSWQQPTQKETQEGVTQPLNKAPSFTSTASHAVVIDLDDDDEDDNPMTTAAAAAIHDKSNIANISSATTTRVDSSSVCSSLGQATVQLSPQELVMVRQQTAAPPPLAPLQHQPQPTQMQYSAPRRAVNNANVNSQTSSSSAATATGAAGPRASQTTTSATSSIPTSLPNATQMQRQPTTATAAATITSSASSSFAPPSQQQHHTQHSASANQHQQHEERPVEKALKGLFPKYFTQSQYLKDAKKLVGHDNTIKKGQFWEAMESAEYIGEGSFGLVWKCRTVEGDIVAVKSCPISFEAEANIDDAYSILREIAIMRFLSDERVPYVLPLHAAFLVEANEALPPHVLEAMEVKQSIEDAAKKVRSSETALKKATTAAENKIRKRMMAEAAKRKRAAVTASQKNHYSNGSDALLDDPDSDAFKARLAELVDADEDVAKARRKHENDLFNKTSRETHLELLMEGTGGLKSPTRANNDGSSPYYPKAIPRLPKFIAIDEESAMRCDATIFLVIDLCDGDLDGFGRGEAITKRAAFCVSMALNAMHRLGLVHLDLKPANILFAYDRSNDGNSSSHGLTAAGNNVGGAVTVKFVLSDFGNCQIVGRQYHDTTAEPALGTYEYMDYEALASRSCSRATDCFSLGCTLYEIMLGKRYIGGCCKPLLNRIAEKEKELKSQKGNKRQQSHLPALKKVPLCSDHHSPRACYAPLFTRGLLPNLNHWLPSDVINANSHPFGETDPSAIDLLPPPPAGPPPSDSSSVTLTSIVAELLLHSRADRMTAAGCNKRLVEAFGVATVVARGKAD